MLAFMVWLSCDGRWDLCGKCFMECTDPFEEVQVANYMDSHLVHGEQCDTLDENDSLFGCLL
jgi:hypothetical protein